MKDLIIDTYLAVKQQLNPNKRKNCFELFGYDFLIDEDFRIWLIEVNTNPYFGVANEYIADLLPTMLDDLCKLVVDPLYPPRNASEIDYASNGFDLLYSEGGSIHSEGPVNQRRPFTAELYPIPALKQTVGIVKRREVAVAKQPLV